MDASTEKSQKYSESITAADIERVMIENKWLTKNGLFCHGREAGRDFLKPEDYEIYREKLRKSDLNLLNEIAALLRPVRKTKRAARSSCCHSYGLKHQLEKLVTGRYIANGELIAVALILGFRGKVCGPNIQFNMFPSDVCRIGGVR